MIERRGPQSIIEFPRARFHARHCNHAVAVHGRAPSFLPVRLMDDVSLIFVIISVLVADDANAFLFLCFSVSLSSHLHAAPRFADDHDAIATDRRTTQRELDGEAALVAQRQDESDAARKTLIELSREFKRSASEVRRRIHHGIIVCLPSRRVRTRLHRAVTEAPGDLMGASCSSTVLTVQAPRIARATNGLPPALSRPKAHSLIESSSR